MNPNCSIPPPNLSSSCVILSAFFFTNSTVTLAAPSSPLTFSSASISANKLLERIDSCEANCINTIICKGSAEVCGGMKDPTANRGGLYFALGEKEYSLPPEEIQT